LQPIHLKFERVLETNVNEAQFSLKSQGQGISMFQASWRLIILLTTKMKRVM